MHINLPQARIYWDKNKPRYSKQPKTRKVNDSAQEQTQANPTNWIKQLKEQAKDIRSDIHSIIKEPIKEKDKVQRCVALINDNVIKRFGQVFNSHYFIGKTIEFFKDIDDKQIFMFLIDNLRAHQQKQGFELHQTFDKEPPYQQVLRQLFESSCKKQVTINGRIINLSPRQAKIILYNLPQWIKEFEGFKGYQKAGKELGLSPINTYKNISAIMKAVGQEDGLEKLLHWNQINSSDWTPINKLFNTLNSEKERTEWLNNHKGFKGYQKAGKELDLGPNPTYGVISAIMKAVGQQEGLEKLLQWNLINSSDWSQINKLFNTLNTEKKRNNWLQEHKGFRGYLKAGKSLKLSPKDTYQTISAIMKAVGQQEGLEKLLQWNLIKFRDWNKINQLYNTLNSENQRKRWLQEHQGFKGYQKAGKELDLGPNPTYGVISAIMKAVGQEDGLEKLLHWNQINSSDWNQVNKLFNTLNTEKKRNDWLQDHQGFKGYQKAGKELNLGPDPTYRLISAIIKAVGLKEGLEKLLQWNQINSSDWNQVNKLFNTLNSDKECKKWLQEHQGFKGYQKAGETLKLSPLDTYQTISAIMKGVGQESGLEKLLKWNKINSSSWDKIISINNSLGETQLEDELKQSLLLLFSRSKDQLNRIITFIESYNETLEKLKTIIELEANTPDFNSVLQQLNISSDMLRALFLSYNSYQLKTFTNKVLGAVYQVLNTQDSEEQSGLSSTLKSRTESSSLQRASELLSFLLDHKDLDQGIKDLIEKSLIEEDEKSIAQIATQIPKEIIQEFSEMNMGI